MELRLTPAPYQYRLSESMNVLSCRPMAMAQTVSCVLFLAVIIAVSWATPWLNSAVLLSPKEEPGVTDLSQNLPKATVHYGNRACSVWTGNRFKCGPKPWHWVGPYSGTTAENHRQTTKRCLWAHPARNAPLTISIPRTEALPHLFGHVALLNTPQGGKSVQVTVALGKKEQRLFLNDRKSGWQNWHIQVPDDSREPLTFTISTHDPDWRHVCLTAFAGEEAP